MLFRGLFLMLYTLNALASEIEIPKFTPNVVDATGSLSVSDISEINQTLQKLREQSDIWAAVYLLDTLEGEAIESLAQRAFKKWKLGTAKQNNGLLLILAMHDRRSRFEVGYGLEGDLPDAITRRALDNILRPNMRKGDTKKAIIDSFEYLAAVKAKDPLLSSKEKELMGEQNSSFASKGSFPALAVYLFCLWLLRPLAAGCAMLFARRLARTHAAFNLEKDKKVNGGRLSPKYLLVGDFGWVTLFLRAFFTVNPGVFVFLGGGASPYAAAGMISLCLLITFFYFRAFAGRYWSAQSYQAYLARLRRKNERLVAKGYMKETSPGEYQFTPAYYSSSEYRASSSRSSSSSSSRSSSSSSSGGGSSGGGGSSSSW